MKGIVDEGTQDGCFKLYSIAKTPEGAMARKLMTDPESESDQCKAS